MLYRTPKILQTFYPKLVWEKTTNEKVIYLTFDDGPIPEVTDFVLYELKKIEAKATFFAIGDNVKKHPEILKKVLEMGHTVGNHTMHHLRGWATPVAEYITDTQACQTELEKHLGPIAKKLFRPPYGRISREQIEILKNEYELIMWTTLSQDYRNDIEPIKCLKNTIAASQSGSIVVFHDSQKAKKNLEYVLPRYLEKMREMGYSFHSL